MASDDEWLGAPRSRDGPDQAVLALLRGQGVKWLLLDAKTQCRMRRSLRVNRSGLFARNYDQNPLLEAQ